MQSSSFFVGPHHTPKSVKWLIALIICCSILSPILTFILRHYFDFTGPGAWLSLSWTGLRKGWLWEPFTYFFIQATGEGISISFLISLFFQMLLLWFTGSEIVYRYGNKAFLLFYLGGGLFCGLIATAALFLFSSGSTIVGSGPPINSLLMLWTMLNPELQLFFFLFIRIKAKWLILVYLCFILLVNLSYGMFIPFLAELCGIIWGFLVGKVFWKLPNPYPLNLNFQTDKKKQNGKIIDISAFQESDEAFMDRMLDKVAKKGEGSLTKRERERMQKISNAKKKEHI
jgi:membrane associated rhomboid family serine protease